ncbi:hypothetical protein [Amycolatopsis echigonensis]|uniref:Uncharacterized protein n=1 Tax=Amycolatopsis echigonensis TaxID=2576905 RepID=A0A2N3WE72_9PSEU|nr:MULTISPECIES: hypothetical protein [Amycolatopsis]MBB2499645.1 hypothetical protein [Amycolatopsis echigonensis]PKV92196.1 hypothetical protein ATK30_2992 [Amycolatopsis niigatensis]
MRTTNSTRPRSFGRNWMIATLLSDRYLDLATGRPLVRPAFMEPLVDAIAKRHKAGWSVQRLTLWLRTTLTDPQTGEVCVLATESFVSSVTDLLGSRQVRKRRGHAGSRPASLPLAA